MTSRVAPIKLHHIGYLVPSIERYMLNSVWTPQSRCSVDSIQQARLLLLSLSGADSPPFIELVEPLGVASPTWAALKRGNGWHHLCFEAGSSQVADDFAEKARMLPVTTWNPAVLFGGRKVRFFYSRNRELLEFLADDEL